MNVLLVGSGGREHALAYKIHQSKTLEDLYLLSGNPGMRSLGISVDMNLKDYNAITKFCFDKKIELVVIGPEQPLVDGMSDFLRENGIKVFGPSKKAADIEAQKSFAKNLMVKYNIPTSGYVEFNSAEQEKAFEYIKTQKYPLVIKADGLAAGKGVLICNSVADAENAIKEIFIDKVFGASGDKLIIEEFMYGEEASIFAITDGKDFICLPSAQDHKRIGDNDTGKNTGGMGAYSPAPVVTKEILSFVEEKIIAPAIKGMEKEGCKFVGCLYCGLMITPEGPKVVEFNCRFGDPETQAVLPILEGDFLQLLYSASTGALDKNAVTYSNGSAVCVVAASKGYPGAFEKGFEITGLDSIADDVVVFQAGTKESEGKVVTNGGRVLGVTAITKETDLKLAKQKAYAALTNIYFGGIYFRKDIADRAINRI
ncbi:MAG: phosphoribosylamine--glycine ligase [Ignavibacteriaceae bacterium]|nr:phosphoribosylamine--glycine ligase [Ignavibacteriaceae bacterium]